ERADFTDLGGEDENLRIDRGRRRRSLQQHETCDDQQAGDRSSKRIAGPLRRPRPAAFESPLSKALGLAQNSRNLEAAADTRKRLGLGEIGVMPATKCRNVGRSRLALKAR